MLNDMRKIIQLLGGSMVGYTKTATDKPYTQDSVWSDSVDSTKVYISALRTATNRRIPGTKAIVFWQHAC